MVKIFKIRQNKRLEFIEAKGKKDAMNKANYIFKGVGLVKVELLTLEEKLDLLHFFGEIPGIKFNITEYISIENLFERLGNKMELKND